MVVVSLRQAKHNKNITFFGLDFSGLDPGLDLMLLYTVYQSFRMI